MALVSINPATGEKVGEYPEMDAAAIGQAIEAAHRAFLQWRELGFEERAARMRRAARLLRDRWEENAGLMTREMGKLLRDSRAEIDKCAWVCEYFAEKAVAFLKPEEIATDASRSYVAFEPLGVVLALMPWNFPFWQVFRCAVPALMAGNAVVLKHASNVSGCALAVEEIFRGAGFPDGLFRALLVSGNRAAAAVEHPRVSGVALTGSVPAGQAVARAAGGLLKKTVLELGGSDPYLILEDADLDQAAEICVRSRLFNGGQSCIAAKRFIVVRPILEEIERRFIERMKAVRIGDPMREDTDLGPMAGRRLRDELHRQVQASIKKGAVRRLGGRIPPGEGAYYPPTVLTGVKPGMPAYEEELFGPVAAIIAVEDEEEAIRAANDSRFGLGAAVFTRDRERGEHIARRRLEAGSCFVNTFVRSDPRLPFGGVKDSGYGRELSSFGIREFVNIKTVYLA
jgi:succinate-semialdehyde dehydrogenase/glutarate-semialdehyde dehydrogenase